MPNQYNSVTYHTWIWAPLKPSTCARLVYRKRHQASSFSKVRYVSHFAEHPSNTILSNPRRTLQVRWPGLWDQRIIVSIPRGGFDRLGSVLNLFTGYHNRDISCAFLQRGRIGKDLCTRVQNKLFFGFEDNCIRSISICGFAPRSLRYIVGQIRVGKRSRPLTFIGGESTTNNPTNTTSFASGSMYTVDRVSISAGVWPLSDAIVFTQDVCDCP